MNGSGIAFSDTWRRFRDREEVAAADRARLLEGRLPRPNRVSRRGFLGRLGVVAKTDETNPDPDQRECEQCGGLFVAAGDERTCVTCQRSAGLAFAGFVLVKGGADRQAADRPARAGPEPELPTNALPPDEGGAS